MASFLMPLIGGIAGLLGGGTQQQASGNYSGQQNQTQSGTSQTSGNTSGFLTPTLSAIQQQMLKQIQTGTSNNVTNATNLTPYTQAGLENINQGSNAAAQAMSANIAGRGLSFSPAATTSQNQNTLSRIAQGNQFLSSVPLLQTQLSQAALGQEMQGFQIQPTAVQTGGSSQSGTASSGTSSSTTSGNQQGTISGNPWAGLAGGIGAGLAAPNGSGGSNIGSILSSLGLGGNGSPSYSYQGPSPVGAQG